MKLKRFNENIDYQKQWETISELWGEVYTAEDNIDGCYNPDADENKKFEEINFLYNETLNILRKFSDVLKKEQDNLYKKKIK